MLNCLFFDTTMFPWSISWKASTPTSIRSSGSSGPLPTLAIHSSLHCYIPAVSHCVNLHLYSFCYAFWDADSSYLHLHVSRTHPAHDNFQEYLVLQLLVLIWWFHILVLKTSCVWTKLTNFASLRETKFLNYLFQLSTVLPQSWHEG